MRTRTIIIAATIGIIGYGIFHRDKPRPEVEPQLSPPRMIVACWCGMPLDHQHRKPTKPVTKRDGR